MKNELLNTSKNLRRLERVTQVLFLVTIAMFIAKAFHADKHLPWLSSVLSMFEESHLILGVAVTFIATAVFKVQRIIVRNLESGIQEQLATLAPYFAIVDKSTEELFDFSRNLLRFSGAFVTSIGERRIDYSQGFLSEIIDDRNKHYGEFLYYWMVETILRTKTDKETEFKFMHYIPSEGIYPLFIKRFQTILRTVPHRHLIKKIYRFRSRVDYEQEDFLENRKMDWAYQVRSSELLFWEGLAPEQLQVAYGEEFVEGKEDNLVKEYFIIKTREPTDEGILDLVEYVICIAKKDAVSFEFKSGQIHFGQPNQVEPSWTECERHFDSEFSEVKRVFNDDKGWKPAEIEYAVNSASNIRNNTASFTRVLAIDSYRSDEQIQTWVQQGQPRWLVWRACQLAIGTPPEDTSRHVEVWRLFLVEHQVFASHPEIEKFDALIRVLAAQEMAGIQVRVLCEENSNELLNKFRSDYGQNPDFALVVSTRERDLPIIRGVGWVPRKLFSQSDNRKEGENFRDLFIQLWNAPNVGILTFENVLERYFEARAFDEASYNETVKRWELELKELESSQFETYDNSFRGILSRVRATITKRIESAEGLALEYWDNAWLHDLPSRPIRPSRIIEQLMRNLKPQNAVVLDAGCGTGRNLYRLIELGFDVRAVDISQRAIDKVIEDVRIEVTKLHCGACDQLSFLPDCSVDAVIACDLLEHIPVWDETLKEFWRVLKPDGFLLSNPLSANDPAYVRYREGAISGKKIMKATFLRDDDVQRGLVVKFTTREQIQYDLKSHSFKEILIVPAEATVGDEALPSQTLYSKHKYWAVTARANKTISHCNIAQQVEPNPENAD